MIVPSPKLSVASQAQASHNSPWGNDIGIPYAEVRLDKRYIIQDGVHPNDAGYEIITGQLRQLMYRPLN